MYLIVAVANACKDVAKHYSAKTVQLPEELLDDKGLATSQDLQPFLELCENDTERAIVRLKAEDFETKQIARTLQISRQTVERILRTLYARYLAS
jgi:DNA-binding NarL/FixJ family response regulator